MCAKFTKQASRSPRSRFFQVPTILDSCFPRSIVYFGPSRIKQIIKNYMYKNRAK